MKQKNKLLSYQAFFVLIHAQIGIGIISMPYDVFGKARTDSWIAVLLTGVVVQCIIFLFGYIMKHYPEHSARMLFEALFGKFIANILLFIYAVYFLALCSLLLARYAILLSTWMMPLTPKWIVIFLMVCIVIYGVTTGLQVMSRFFLLASVIFAIYFLFACYALKDASFTFVLPVGSTGFKGIVAGIMPAYEAFQGYEVMLLMYPFIAGTAKTKMKVATYANLFVTLFYTFVVLVTIVFLSEQEIKLTPEPLLYLVKSFSFKIIERPDLIFTSIWLILVATTIMVVFFHANLVVQLLIKDKQSNRTIYFLAMIVFLISLIPNGIYEVGRWLMVFKWPIYMMSIFLPICYALMTFMKNVVKEQKE